MLARCTAPILLVAACGGAAPRLPPATAKAPSARTVTYRWSSDVRGRNMSGDISDHTRGCSRIVLAETIVQTRGDRPVEIAATVVDGNDASCGVGAKLRLVPGVNGAMLEATPPLDGATFEHVRRIHSGLGRSIDGLAFLPGERPWDRPLKRVRIGDVDYLDLENVGGETFHGNSDGHSYTASRLRLRATDHAVACMMHAYTASGVNFEWGGWSQDEHEWLEVDYGDGKPTCPDR